MSQDATHMDKDSLRIGKRICRYAGVHGVCFLKDWDLRIYAGCGKDNIIRRMNTVTGWTV